MIRELTSDCVHCGFCLPTCPTYVLWSEEMDSPRGRIALMDARLDGTVTLNATVTEHFDRCLGCMACVSSCPSGVRYDRLIETTRAAVEREHRREWSDRLARWLLFRILPHPGRMRVALRLAPLGRFAPMPRRLRPLVDIAPSWRARAEIPAVTPASGRPKARVGVLTGCVQSAVFPDVNAATVRVLAADGFEVVAPPQGCCGALSVHAGRLAEGKTLASSLIERFRNVDLVVVNASGCGSHLKELGWLLGDERAAEFAAKVRDVGELLADTSPRASRHPVSLRRRAPGLVPPAPRAAAAAVVGLRARPDPRSRGRRARGAGPLLRLRRDLQRRPAGGRARARRPQGRARPRDRRAGVREREPGLPRAGLAGARASEAPAAGAPSDRARGRLDSQRRSGTPARRGPALGRVRIAAALLVVGCARPSGRSKSGVWLKPDPRHDVRSARARPVSARRCGPSSPARGRASTRPPRSRSSPRPRARPRGPRRGARRRGPTRTRPARSTR